MMRSEPPTWSSNMYRLLFILAMLMVADAACAQSRALGCTFSYSGTGISYEHRMDDESFIDAQLRAETASVFTYGSKLPGVSASFTWNMIFASTESVNGNCVRFYGGPGLALGMAEDLNASAGMYFGLKGRVGCECVFPRRIILSFSLSPLLGAHLKRVNSGTTMLPFKMGLLHGIMPEVGIKYAL